ncbi:MAG TPA: agmatine deiminase family protein [Candidatus Hydrogenedentes bacterium]|nr:agmatine deiminase family protein [Candidatus Hydrogenedentota bacterium]
MSSSRLPAEWEPHRATHLAWPANSRDWPGKFASARWAFVEFARHLAEVEQVRIVVTGALAEQAARRMLEQAHVNLSAVVFHQFPLDRGWMRDISPCFVVDGKGRLCCRRFRFNGWAKYDNHKRDARWASEIAGRLRLPLTDVKHKGGTVTLEGGALDGNGRGSLLTTEECLLDQHCQPRNPGFGKGDYEACFKKYLGVTNLIWLNEGILGDDTHGHVDDVCRFVNPTTVVCCREKNRRSRNYAALEENIERLQGARLENGGGIACVPLPLPSPLYFRKTLLPASYANFYIANGTVLVPTFNDSNDRIALGVLSELFPDRRVVGIHAVDLVWGFGTLHCLSHEEPAASR